MMIDNDQKLIGLTENRALVYRFLARMFRGEPDQDLLPTIEQTSFPFEDSDPLLGEGHQALRNFLKNFDGENVVLTLAVDFARIFLGVEVNGAFPYESVYTSQERLVMQDARQEMLVLYQKAGLEKNDRFSEPEDHISLQFEYLAYLCHQIIHACELGEVHEAKELLEDQKSFLHHHMLLWVDRFCDDISRVSKTDFYKALAKITNRWINYDLEIISEYPIE